MFENYSKKPHLDNVTANFLEELNNMGGKPLYELTSQEARQFFLDLQSKNHKPVTANVTDLNIETEQEGAVRVRFVRPENYNEPLPVILYLHGGGWVMGDEITHDMLIRKLAVCTNSVVVFVNYTRSPEAVYPKAFNQAYGVLKHLAENAGDFNIDPDRIAVAGDSAG